MYAFLVNDDKLAQVPASLSAWTRSLGPRRLVAELDADLDTHAPSAAEAVYTLRGFTARLGARMQALCGGLGA